ncbi:MAG: ribosome maturation factor RimP, partial [Candidatus Zixiibacteriota bacterium]
EKLLPLVKEENLELVDLEFSPGGSKALLRIYVDKPASGCGVRRGVTIDECANLSRKVSDFLDMEDLIPHRYNLEVSSPGLDRPLVKREDFIRKVGEKVRVFLKEPVDGKLDLVGEIKRFQKETLYLSTLSEGAEPGRVEEKAVPFSNVLKAKIIY